MGLLIVPERSTKHKALQDYGEVLLQTCLEA